MVYCVSDIVDNELRGCDSLDVRRIAANLF